MKVRFLKLAQAEIDVALFPTTLLVFLAASARARLISADLF